MAMQSLGRLEAQVATTYLSNPQTSALHIYSSLPAHERLDFERFATSVLKTSPRSDRRPLHKRVRNCLSGVGLECKYDNDPPPPYSMTQ